jgi:hypothetical protein
MNHKTAGGLLVTLAGLVAAATSAVASAGAAGFTALMPANHPGIIYEGRQATNATGAVRLGFPGVTAHLRFRGRDLTMAASASNDEAYFDVSIDGGGPTVLRLKRGAGSYRLWQGATAAEHLVTLTRRTESWMGTCEIVGGVNISGPSSGAFVKWNSGWSPLEATARNRQHAEPIVRPRAEPSCPGGIRVSDPPRMTNRQCSLAIALGNADRGFTSPPGCALMVAHTR